MSCKEMIEEYRRMEKLIARFNSLIKITPNLGKLTFEIKEKELRFICEKEKSLKKNGLKKLSNKDE